MRYAKLIKILIHFDLNRNANNAYKEKMRISGWPWWNEDYDMPVTPVVDLIYRIEFSRGPEQVFWRPSFGDIIQYDCAKAFTEELRYSSDKGYAGGEKPIAFLMKTIRGGFEKYMFPVAKEFRETGRFNTTKRFKEFKSYIEEECKGEKIFKPPEFHLEFKNDLKEKIEE